MNKLEELELLTELQNLSIGTNTYDNIEVGCGRFEVVEKESKLRAQITIDVRKTNWRKTGKYFEDLLYSSEIGEEIGVSIITKIKNAIEKRKSNTRKEIREMLGMPEPEETIPNRE